MPRNKPPTTEEGKGPQPGAPQPADRLWHRVQASSANPWLVYPIAVGATALATLLRWALGRLVGESLSPFLTFYPIIMLVALLAGTGPGLVATLLSVLTVDFFFLPPGGFGVALPADQLGLAIFLGINVAVSFVGGALRSARHRAYAEALRAQASEERFRLFLDHTPTLVWIKDAEGHYVYLNRAYERRFGLSAAACQGKTDAQLWPPEVAARLREADRSALVASQPLEVTEETTDTNGTRSSWLNTKFPYRDASGQQFVASIGLDITPRKQAEDALRESEARFRILFETSPLSTFLIDPDTQRILDCNQQAGGSLGYSCAELCQLHLSDIEANLAPEQIAGVVSQVAQGRQVSFETQHRTRSGEIRDVLVTGRLLQLQGRPVHYSTAIDITDRKRAEEALRQSEAKFRLLFAHAPDAIFLTIPGGQITAANPAACAMFGMSEPELIRAGRAGLVDPKDGRHAIALAERHRTGKVCVELNYIRKNGEVFTAETHSVVLGGEPLRSFAILRDVTERKRFEEALRDSEAHLRLAVETAELGTYERDLLSNELSMNPTCKDILGVYEGPFPSDVARRSVHPEDRERVFGAVARAFDPALREICAAEFRILRPDGSVRWIAGRGRVIFDDTVRPPRPLRFLGVINDITPRKQAERQLERRNQHLQILHQAAARLLVGQLPVELLADLHRQLAGLFGVDVFMLFQPDEGGGRLRLRAWGGLSEEEQGQLQRLRYGRAICAQPAQALQPIIATHIQTAEAANRRFLRKLGFRSYLYYPLILNHRLQGTLAFASRQRDDYDPTDLEFFHTLAGTLAEALERRRLQLELQHHAAVLEQTVQERTARLRDTVAELEGFSYSLVHDMRAPLRAMLSFAEILQIEAGPRLEARQSDLLRKIKIAAIRMDQLVTDSLNYSKILRQELPLTAVNLGPLLRGMVETYPNLNPVKADVSIEVGDICVQANESALTQVFSNLLDNAVKFVAPGVHPRVRVWTDLAPSSLGPHPSVRVYVEDNGIGIAQDQQEKIFGMFERIHRADQYTGTGIGLALVKKSLERTGGRISLQSEPERGTCFCVELPLAPSSAEAAAA